MFRVAAVVRCLGLKPIVDGLDDFGVVGGIDERGAHISHDELNINLGVAVFESRKTRLGWSWECAEPVAPSITVGVLF